MGHPAGKILTLAALHAVLAALLLLLVATVTGGFHPNHHHHHQDRLAPVPPQLPRTAGQQLTTDDGVSLAILMLAYTHAWCATVGFGWWYVSQWCAGVHTTRLWEAGETLLFHALSLGMMLGLGGEMVFVGAKALSLYAVSGSSSGYGSNGWAVDGVLRLVVMAVVGGPLSVLFVVFLPRTWWYLRPVARVLRWELPDLEFYMRLKDDVGLKEHTVNMDMVMTCREQVEKAARKNPSLIENPFLHGRGRS
ncbi:uncharacterized protein B0T15DRAFT_498005 [Chaetomium strumarium]|uniref:TLC domain-containing protein n=1 Tax=Chaetomium strumarium TaxID=1170767 RepID=A0AAJ0H1G0_9PEZI|nr:hypothetical protein B0T15DRAFT_498005 [Chaetomium strumarium]